MNYDNPLFFTMSLVGIVFFLAGLLMYMYPPKKINALYGYRTKTSKSSQEAWDFAQRLSRIFLIVLAIDAMLLAFVGAKLDVSEKVSLIVIGGYLFFCILFIFFGVEYQLKKKFKKR